MDREFLEELGLEPEALEAVLQRWEQESGAFQARLRQQQVEHAVESAVSAAGGRNLRAIRALLDEDAIAGSEDIPAAAKQAVRAVRRENGYLFAGVAGAPGTGSASMENLTMEELGRLSMEEYRKYRGVE